MLLHVAVSRIPSIYALHAINILSHILRISPAENNDWRAVGKSWSAISAQEIIGVKKYVFCFWRSPSSSEAPLAQSELDSNLGSRRTSQVVTQESLTTPGDPCYLLTDEHWVEHCGTQLCKGTRELASVPFSHWKTSLVSKTHHGSWYRFLSERRGIFFQLGSSVILPCSYLHASSYPSMPHELNPWAPKVTYRG